MNHSRELSTLHINDIDAMYNELENKPRLHENLQKLIEEYGQGPNTAENLDLINKRLEREGYMRNNNSLETPLKKQEVDEDEYKTTIIHESPLRHKQNPVISKLDDLEQLLLGHSHKKSNLRASRVNMNIQEFNSADYTSSPSKLAP